jgi:hypothetical protein
MPRTHTTLALALASLATLALLAAGCSGPDTPRDPLDPGAGPADAKAGPDLDGDPMLLALRGALDQLTDDDFDHIVIEVTAGASEASGSSVNQPAMPPLTLSFTGDHVVTEAMTFEVWVPLLDRGQPLDLPGNCIPIRYRTDIDDEALANLVLHVPYFYFDDTLVLTGLYRTFRLTEDNDGLPYAADVQWFVNGSYDPFSPGAPFSAILQDPEGRPETELVDIIIDPEGDDED